MRKSTLPNTGDDAKKKADLEKSKTGATSIPAEGNSTLPRHTEWLGDPFEDDITDGESYLNLQPEKNIQK
jgi:hypothetical protein